VLVDTLRKFLPAVASIVIVLVLASPAAGLPPVSFTDQNAMDLFDHTFKEEYWTAEDVSISVNDASVSFAVSYAQYKSVDAFLVAFNQHEKAGNVSTLPFQLFGLHYYTPEGNEVLIGAVLAFLMAFNDTHNGAELGHNGIPDPGHDSTYYVIPFGLGGVLSEEDYVPEADPMQAQKLGEGHFRFGQTYRNLYAKVIGSNNPVELILSAAFPIYIAKFSELTIEYEIKVDEASGTVTAETFYTIGEVSKLWLWGQEVDPHSLGEDWGLAAVHYVVVVTSQYAFTGNDPDVNIETGITEIMDEDIDMRVGAGRERAFTIGHRGKYDLIDEATGSKIVEDQDAMALTLQSTGADALLVAWQAGLSMDIFTTAAWAVSDSLQSLYKSPRALYNNAGVNGRGAFTAAPLWYASSFPNWNGYRVEHDPTYTCYANVAFETEPPEDKAPGFGAAIVLMALAVPTFVYFGTRRK
jgi:hypothetical protein